MIAEDLSHVHGKHKKLQDLKFEMPIVRLLATMMLKESTNIPSSLLLYTIVLLLNQS